ncbi:Alpha-ribazole phosphatase [[Eubacterium] contortum]|uniref:phosphoglycerate mutase (2,3-diphosphoglycerate-dependent) n=1 Tax=Faecalicatena contorta TaxID=39482 RepID=A0A173YPW6_9FIRM|nr:histidine phosphatase family protein [Faecalicatena contorta]CUN64838.1 Alpha-ribazole phosphatase [[Eubacterium] contortum] [Faecalicatena contorta]
MNKMNIYIIRHGETVLNVQGHVDITLNENGKKLATITGEALKDIPFDIVFTSPLCRALDTARLATKPSGQN